MTETSRPPIGFIDLLAQRRRLGSRIDEAVMGVINSGAYIMGPPVQAFEKALATFGQAGHALSCANGTDALVLPLMAWHIRTGDAVFCPSFTFAATGEVVPWLGATPVFVDIDPVTYNLDPVHLEASIEAVLKEGKLKPKVIIAVDLFGQPADYPAISAIAKKYGLKLIADSAQGFGCTLHHHHPIHWADVATTSFFPAKPLGCYGDGGAVLTHDYDLWEVMDSLRVHGKATASDLAGKTFEHDPKYLNIRIGMNSRLDTVQAAILLEKLAVFAEEIDARNKIASRYNQLLGDVVRVPAVIEGGVSTWAQYTIELADRDGLAAYAKSRGVPTAAYYPIPIHKQDVYSRFPVGPGGLPVTEAKAGQVISLPMHPDLDVATQDYIVETVRNFARRNY
ncbi:UDP-2-acetamido-2-deoxy-3-oxo-D-glucuronate aminotransferase [Candidatus Phycosocius bacilliformis]|uniref:UDP-2-acetamido-2-deoxy-3-oxo-D-glucuronate aminotransferase n=1 Tax=Candidatus Phycosocius bacilliformis TaxID=1445552 RepID=A0A2P2E6J5_9PROT|nr:DegT/DnrJ/EryC1/StrS aminotransferase family protein [Candidatus Phycosocius bacilliformis]GBF56668.1 UDP-2-acetamido-2-deoxy-3-oxo-D-glucuronate aminotransferase [Candidatus Phycosocius bacilliformis]